MDPQADDAEVEAASRYFKVIHNRTEVQHGDLVIGRYSVLPFYRELEQDVQRMGGQMINTYRQHQFIADMREWCSVLGPLTPKLYERLEDLPETGPFVVKGETNSRKHQWNTHMFARTRREACEVAARLADDSLIGQQQIYARDYVPLKTYFEGLNGLPVTDEYRYFVCGGRILCGSFYWSSHSADFPNGEVPLPGADIHCFVQRAVDRIGDHANFYAIDVARTAAGGMTVIEINDGQMSGTSMNTPKDLYMRLRLGLSSMLTDPSDGASSAGCG